MSKGFTILEMGIVLTVIGLIIGGILAGQTLVRSSKVQTIITDVAKFKNAVVQFKQKYGAIPGDMNNATNYWGTNPNCATPGGLGTGTQTCNGNGDGQIEYSSTPVYEEYLVWQHLANAGLITGQYTGTTVSGYVYYYAAAGINEPGGSINPGQVYSMRYVLTGFGPNYNHYWALPPGHYLGVANGITTSASSVPLLSVPEAYGIDSKVDDGLPGQGNWTSADANGPSNPNCAVISGTSNPPTDGTVASEATAVYNVKYGSALACSFQVNIGF